MEVALSKSMTNLIDTTCLNVLNVVEAERRKEGKKMKKGLRIKRAEPGWDDEAPGRTMDNKLLILVTAVVLLLIVIMVYMHLNTRIELLKTQIETLIGYIEVMQ